MPQARGHLSVTTGGTLAMTAAGGFVALTDANIGALVTTGTELTDFDEPNEGRLRYTAAASTPFALTAAMTVRGTTSTLADFSFRIAVNGTTIATSEQTRTLWDFLGNQGLSLEALVTLDQNDYVEIWASTDTDATLEVVGFSLLAQADQPTATITATVVSGDLRGEIQRDKLASEVLLEVVDFAPRLAVGETVASGAVDVRDYDGADASSMVSGIASNSTTVSYTLTGGDPGTLFFVEALATTSTGAVRGQRFRLEVLGP